MSEECCGPNEPRKPGTVRRIELSRPLSTGDACCAAEPSSKTAAPSAVHDAGDACCGPDLATTPTEAEVALLNKLFGKLNQQLAAKA